MTWVVVTQASLTAWLARTDPDRDADLRITVLSWVVGLTDGPPNQGILDPLSGNWYAEVGDTRVWIEYVLLPDLNPPAIVIRGYL